MKTTRGNRVMRLAGLVVLLSSAVIGVGLTQVAAVRATEASAKINEDVLAGLTDVAASLEDLDAELGGLQNGVEDATQEALRIHTINVNEAAAVAYVRAIHGAQFAYREGNGSGGYGTLAQLVDPEEGGRAAGFLASWQDDPRLDAYSFTVSVTPGPAGTRPGYTCTATPVASGQTGERAFFTDESGVVHYTTDGTVPDAYSPVYHN